MVQALTISDTSNNDKLQQNSKIKTAMENIWGGHSDVISLFILVFVIWAIGFALFGNDVVGPESQLFKLAVLFISAKIAGFLVSLIKLPPMVGMLLMGVLLRNVDFINVTGSYAKFTAVLR